MINRSKGRDRIRIACIGARGMPSNYSGIERACEGLYSELARRGHDVTVYCRNEYVPKEISSYRGVRLISLPALHLRSLDTLSHVTASLLHALVCDRYDVIHLHALAPGIVSPFCRLAKTPIVATIHGLDWQRAKWKGAGSKILKLGERCLVRNAAQMIVVSGELRQYFRTEYGRDTVHIPNGVEAPTAGESEDTGTLSEFGLLPRDYVLYLGRLVPEKRIEDLIIAYREVPGTRPLVIVGAGEFTGGYVGDLKRLAAGDSRVMFTGAQQRPVVHSLLHNAALFVLPSELEGLPMSLLECIQHGTPAVVSDIGPHRELLGPVQGYNLFFTATDTIALRDRMIQALGAEDHYRRVARCARLLIERNHSWASIAQSTEEVFYASLEHPTTNGPVLARI